MKKDFKFYVCNTVYNIIELIIVILICLLFKSSLKDVFSVLIMFWVCRWVFPKPKHYKEWWKCFIWSTLIILSICFLIRIDILYALIFTMFTVLTLSGKCDICDMFLWKGSNSNYQDIVDYIKYNNLNDNLLSFEDKISKQNNLTFMIYKYRFKDNLTFKEISEKLDIETQRITEELNKIAFAIRIYCKI